ncbi:MAG: hypothetical protein ABJN62_13165 [Halioglobus sp.]
MMGAQPLALFQEEMGQVVPFFRTHCYPDNPIDMVYSRYIHMVEEIAQDISTLFETDRIEPADIVFCHTAYSFCVHGIALALFRLKVDFRVNLTLSTMFNPGFKSSSDNNTSLSPIEEIRYRSSFELLRLLDSRPSVNINICAPSKSYQTTYQELWPHKHIDLHPSICNSNLAPGTFSKQNRTTVLMYLGCPKQTKGMRFTLGWAESHVLAYPNIDFIFHYNYEFPTKEDFSQCSIDLRKLAEYENFHLIEGPIGEEQYALVIARSDIFFLLYDPSEYEFKTSGVFWDALRSGPHKFFFASSKTWISDELSDIGIAHETVVFGDSDSLTDAFLRAQDSNFSHGEATPQIDENYYMLLTSNFGKWSVERYGIYIEQN